MCSAAFARRVVPFRQCARPDRQEYTHRYSAGTWVEVGEHGGKTLLRSALEPSRTIRVTAEALADEYRPAYGIRVAAPIGGVL